MAGIIEISDTNREGVLSFDMIDILNSLTSEGYHLLWTILELEATGDLGPCKNILDLEHEIEDSPSGLTLNWEELIRLARSFDQVVNITIIGHRVMFRGSIPPLKDGNLYEISEIVIEAIDSSFWRVYARDINIINRLKVNFREVVDVALQ